MRKIILGLLLTIVLANNVEAMQVLGNRGSSRVWVYLCGLTHDNMAEQDIENRQIIDQLGKQLDICFLAIHPFDRCEPAGGRLCWIHYTHEQATETFAKIQASTKGYKIRGYLGFSNGGFFLNQIAQMRELGVPVISVGAAGSVTSPKYKNNLTLIIGREELVYGAAVNFARASYGSALRVRLLEHEGDHVLPFTEVRDVLAGFSNK